MRSESTARRERPGSDRDASRLIALAIAVMVTLSALAGCAEGSVEDAERGRLRDAQRTSVVDDRQATESARVLNPGTPPPSTPTPES